MRRTVSTLVAAFVVAAAIVIASLEAGFLGECFSSLERDFYQPGLALYQPDATGLLPCWETIRAWLGYRPQLTTAQLPSSLTTGEAAPVTITCRTWAGPHPSAPAATYAGASAASEPKPSPKRARR